MNVSMYGVVQGGYLLEKEKKRDNLRAQLLNAGRGINTIDHLYTSTYGYCIGCEIEFAICMSPDALLHLACN